MIPPVKLCMKIHSRSQALCRPPTLLYWCSNYPSCVVCQILNQIQIIINNPYYLLSLSPESLHVPVWSATATCDTVLWHLMTCHWHKRLHIHNHIVISLNNMLCFLTMQIRPDVSWENLVPQPPVTILQWRVNNIMIHIMFMSQVMITRGTRWN